jgi:hypothetical protein
MNQKNFGILYKTRELGGKKAIFRYVGAKINMRRYSSLDYSYGWSDQAEKSWEDLFHYPSDYYRTTGEERSTIMRTTLSAIQKICIEKEVPGYTEWKQRWARKVRKDYDERSQRAAVSESSVHAFVSQLNEADFGIVLRNHVYSMYSNYCAKESIQALTSKSFGNSFFKLMNISIDPATGKDYRIRGKKERACNLSKEKVEEFLSKYSKSKSSSDSDSTPEVDYRTPEEFHLRGTHFSLVNKTPIDPVAKIKREIFHTAPSTWKHRFDELPGDVYISSEEEEEEDEEEPVEVVLDKYDILRAKIMRDRDAEKTMQIKWDQGRPARLEKRKIWRAKRAEKLSINPSYEGDTDSYEYYTTSDDSSYESPDTVAAKRLAGVDELKAIEEAKLVVEKDESESDSDWDECSDVPSDFYKPISPSDRERVRQANQYRNFNTREIEDKDVLDVRPDDDSEVASMKLAARSEVYSEMASIRAAGMKMLQEGERILRKEAQEKRIAQEKAAAKKAREAAKEAARIRKLNEDDERARRRRRV